MTVKELEARIDGLQQTVDWEKELRAHLTTQVAPRINITKHGHGWDWAVETYRHPGGWPSPSGHAFSKRAAIRQALRATRPKPHISIHEVR